MFQVCSKDNLVLPIPGEMMKSDYSIFAMDWSHHLDKMLGPKQERLIQPCFNAFAAGFAECVVWFLQVLFQLMVNWQLFLLECWWFSLPRRTVCSMKVSPGKESFSEFWVPIRSAIQGIFPYFSCLSGHKWCHITCKSCNLPKGGI